jgi:hypothetical protein
MRRLLLALALALVPGVACADTITGENANVFNRNIGFVTHFDRTDGQWQNFTFLQSLLKTENIHFIRTPLSILSNPTISNFVQTLDDQDRPDAIRSDQLLSPGMSASQMKSLMNVWGVSYFELPNERDLQGGAWAAGDLADLQQAIEGAKPWSLQLIAPSVVFADPAQVASNAYDFGNEHDYPCGGTAIPESTGCGGDVYGNGTVYGSEAYGIATARRAAPGKPVVSTESGYSTGSGGVSEYAQAVYLERLILLHAQHGVVGFLYDLVDDNQSYGIARIDGTLKPSAYALSGFMIILSDAAPSSAACTLDATITAPAPVDSFLVCKANGEKDLVLWQPITANATGTPVSVNVSVANGGFVREYLQDVSFHWLEKDFPNMTNLSASDRPIIIAFNAGPVVSVPTPPSP